MRREENAVGLSDLRGVDRRRAIGAGDTKSVDGISVLIMLIEGRKIMHM